MIKKAADMTTEVRTNMRGGEGSVTIKHFFKPEEFTSKTRLCARIIIPPGAGIGTHQHLTEDEVYIITRGTGLLSDGKTETRVYTGDAVLTGNGDSHSIKNDGKSDLEMTAVIMCYPE